jgi:hypothetical protein
MANLLKGYLRRKENKIGEEEKKREIANNKLVLVYRNR